MAVELLGNLGESTLSAAITSTSATTLTVTSATPFPAAVTGTSQFRVIVDSELMIVTNVSGTTFTVTRGAEGTTAATHSSLAPITHVITAAVLAALGVPAGAGGAGKVLTSGSADYAQAWAPQMLLPIPGYTLPTAAPYVIPGWRTSAVSSVSIAVDTLLYFPIFVTPSQAFTALVAEIVTAAAGTLRMGIYNDAGGSAPTGATSVVVEGTISSGTTGVKEITISQTLSGWYWLALTCSASVVVRSVSGIADMPTSARYTTPSATNTPPVSLTRSSTAAASSLPASPVATGQQAANANGALSMWLKI